MAGERGGADATPRRSEVHVHAPTVHVHGEPPSGRPMLNLIVSAVRSDAVTVQNYGEVEPYVVAGSTTVEFTTADNQRFDIDWTYRSDPLPEVGTRWTLAPVSDGSDLGASDG